MINNFIICLQDEIGEIAQPQVKHKFDRTILFTHFFVRDMSHFVKRFNNKFEIQGKENFLNRHFSVIGLWNWTSQRSLNRSIINIIGWKLNINVVAKFLTRLKKPQTESSVEKPSFMNFLIGEFYIDDVTSYAEKKMRRLCVKTTITI